MYTVLVYGKCETWEKSFTDYYYAIKYAYGYKDKGFTVDIIEV